MRKHQTHLTGRRLRDALPQAQEYTCLLTPDGFLARVSPDLERDFGPAALGLEGQPFFALVQEDDQVGVRAALSWVRDDGAPVVFECRWHHNDGSWRWLEWTAARRPKETVLVAVGRDVTRWREDEALALGQSRVLEQIVRNAPLSETSIWGQAGPPQKRSQSPAQSRNRRKITINAAQAEIRSRIRRIPSCHSGTGSRASRRFRCSRRCIPWGGKAVFIRMTKEIQNKNQKVMLIRRGKGISGTKNRAGENHRNIRIASMAPTAVTRNGL